MRVGEEYYAIIRKKGKGVTGKVRAFILAPHRATMNPSGYEEEGGKIKREKTFDKEYIDIRFKPPLFITTRKDFLVE